jgi:hypothetical protein
MKTQKNGTRGAEQNARWPSFASFVSKDVFGNIYFGATSRSLAPASVTVTFGALRGGVRLKEGELIPQSFPLLIGSENAEVSDLVGMLVQPGGSGFFESAMEDVPVA